MYYTEGMRMEYTHYKKLLHLKFPLANKYYTSIDYKAFTPTDIRIPYIMYGDRPYASTFLISQLSEGVYHNLTINSGYSFGVIGALTNAEYLQTRFHKKIGSPPPMGWRFQIANNPLLQYQYVISCYLVNVRFIKCNVSTVGVIGTDNKFGVHGNLKFPYFRNKFMELYTFGNYGSNLVLWNSTLNGGFINKSIYTLKFEEVERIVYTYKIGFMLKIKGIGISSSIEGITKEFETGGKHKWSNIDLSFRF
jgi:hypothetical protein